MPKDHRYLVKSVVHSVQVLSAFGEDEALPLAAIATRSRLPRTMAFRLLYTLEQCGLVEKVAKNLYRTRGIRMPRKFSSRELRDLAGTSAMAEAAPAQAADRLAR